MKRKSLLFLLLMALFGPLAMNAQTTYSWGSSSTNSGTDRNANPFGRYYGYEYRVYLYPPNTLPFSGNITQIEFLPSSTLSSNGGQMTVWMKTVTDITSLSSSTTFATYKSGATQVYNTSSSPSYTSGSYVSIPLSTPIAYNYTNNEYLMILVRSVANAGGGDGGSTFYYYNPSNASNNTLYAKNDNSDPGENTTSGWSYYNTGEYLPVIRVTYTASSTPSISLSPNSAMVLTGSTQSLTATVRNVTGTPSISYSSSNTSVATVSGSGTSATVTGVSAGTATITATLTYQGSTYTATSAITVKEGAVVGDAWSDDFEGTSCGWELINGTLTNQWVWGTAVNNGGTHALYISKDGGTSNTYSGAETKVFAAKLLSFTEGKFTFSYDWRCKGESTWDFLRVALVPASQTLTAGTDYSTITQPGLPTGWIALDGGKLNLQETWQSKEVTVNVTAGNYYMVLAWRNETGTYDPPAAVDNVSITRVACPYDVEDLAVSGTPTTTSATVIWTAGSASQWQVEYSTSSSFPAGSSTQTVSSATATLSPLQPSSTYYVRVRSYCGGTDYGAWSSVISVNTACDAITTLPWSEDFTGLTSGIPNCWDNSDGTTTSDSYKWNYYNDGHTATPCLRFDSYYNGTGNTNFLKTPVLDLSSWSDVTLSFAFKNPAGGDFSVYISTDGGSTYTTLLQGGLTGQSTWTEIEDLDLSDYDGEDNVVIVFKGTSNYGSSGAYIYLDDVRVDGTPSSSCTKPTNFIASNITKNSVQLSWTPGGEETEWRITITGGMTDVINVTTSDLVNGVYTLGGLSPETTYNVFVQAVCGEGDNSNPVGPVTFTTLEPCPAPTNLNVSNLAASHATVSWDSEAGNYTVRYSTATVTGTTLDPVFEDGFEDGLGNWTTYANGTSAESTDWQQYTGTFSGGSGGPHTGSYVAMSRSWSSETGDISVDNWLVSPQMTLGNTLKFWVITSEGYPESYAVYVSTGSGVVPSSGTGDFQVVANLTPATGTWTEMTYDISAYAGQQGYVAIRHKDSSKDHLLVDDFGVYNTINTYSYGSWTTVTPNPTTESCQITGLSAETLYEVQVQANCGGTDGSSAWSTIHFTTPDNCGAPQELATSNITAATATLSWADDKDSYNLQYRKVYFHEGFESETMPAGWTTVDSNSDGLCWQIGSSTAHSGVNGVCNSSFVYDSEFSLSTTPDDYLISPQLDLQGTLRVWLSGYPRSSSNYSEHFEILLSTTGTSVSDFTTTLVTESTTTNSYVEYTADLSSYTGKGYIAIHHFNCTNQNYLYVDDFGLYGNENWVTLNPNPTTETANLTGLTPIIENDYHLLPTTYEWQVQGVNCDGNGGTTDWSAPATFTTREGFKKNIIGRTTGGYQLIASPIGQVAPANDVTNMTANSFDLYRYNANATLQWENYKQEGEHYHFNLDPGRGYLYANSETVDLVFMGAEYSGNALEVTLNAQSASGFQNWNLVGNPFAETAHITAQGHTLNYYTVGVKDGQTNQYIEATNTSIQPMEGVFVIAIENGEKITFVRGESKTRSSQLVLNVNSSRNLVDRAIVRFDECRQLPKFQLNEDYTKVYIPMDGEEYAVVHGEEMGELPVNFKAEENGHYSLNLSSENVEFAYLHLIDNLTGNEVDLLQTPNYSFEAKTTDYASRFKLVYATGDNSNSDNFAFFSNGSFVINNDGVAELQVVDIMGRILSSETINGCTNVSVNAAPGVYTLRLINGTDVKVQKVVVK